MSVNPDYANLFRKAVRFMASAWKYFEPECQNPKAFLDRFRKSTKYYVSMESLEEIYDSIGDSVSDWDMLKSLLDFKCTHRKMWRDLAKRTEECFSIGYWESPRKLAHITLEKRTHFLVHSVDALNGSYYNNFLKGVPVSCSVFDVGSPWWYKYDDRRIALVYDTSECEVLGASERDCSSVLHKKATGMGMTEEIFTAKIAMPDIWDFDMTFQFRPWVDRRELLRQMYKHDPNDVGEVIVLGKPCDVIVRDTDRIPNWPDEELTFSRFFGTHIYISENKKLKLYSGQ